MRHAVGGLLAAMAESTLVFAPHFNSFRRLRPSPDAPTAVAWGYENRMVAIRIPGGPTGSRRSSIGFRERTPIPIWCLPPYWAPR